MAKTWWGLKNKKRLVLDIGSSAVRVCEMTKTKTGYAVSKYAQVEYNSDPSLDEQQRKDIRTKALQDAMKQAKLRKRKAILGVPGQSVFTRCRALPPVPIYKLDQIVRYEIQQQIPFGLDQIAMDYHVLGRTEQGGFDVMMAAIKVDVVEKHLDAIKPIKAAVGAVDVLPLAAYNWLKHQELFGDGSECVALVNIGAGTTDIVIERGNQFRFTRPLNIGGNEITRALMDAFNLDFVSAERIKRERGFAPTGDAKRDGKGGEVIGQVLQRLCGEIIRSFSYFRSLPGGGQVNRVLLTGGGASLKNIVPYLRSQLDMDVRPVDPLKGIEIAKAAAGVKEHANQACAILGMALRFCDKVTIEIDLIPPRILETARRKEQALYWALSVWALILIFASLVPAAANQNKHVLERIEALKRAIRAYDPELAQRIRPGVSLQSELRDQLQARKSQLQVLEDQVNALDQARRQRRFWLDEIMFVNDARPILGGIWFSSIETTFISDEMESQDAQAQPQQQPMQMQGAPLMGRRGDDDAPGGMRAMGGRTQRSAGFTGISSGGAGGMQPPGGRMMGGPAPQQSAEETPFQNPNGLIIRGYAESDEIINEYIEELKRASRPLPNDWFMVAGSVLFTEVSVQRVPWEVLYEAPSDGGVGRGGAAVAHGQPSLFSFTVEIRLRFTRERPGLAQRPQASEGGTA